jgi:transposase
VARAKEILEMLLVMAICGMIDLRFCDETAFKLEFNIPYGWGPKGCQQGIKAIKRGNLNVFGLLDKKTGALTSYLTEGKVNSDQVIEWLDDFASTLNKPTIVVMDNAPWHRSRALMNRIAYWEDKNLLIYHLPTYCPHLNPIEITWKMMKYQWLRLQDFESKESLHNRIRHILANFQTQEFELNYDQQVVK